MSNKLNIIHPQAAAILGITRQTGISKKTNKEYDIIQLQMIGRAKTWGEDSFHSGFQGVGRTIDLRLAKRIKDNPQKYPFPAFYRLVEERDHARGESEVTDIQLVD